MKEIFKANLCKCNNCDLLLVDQNPQTDAIEYPIFEDKNRQWVNSENVGVAEMEYLEDEDGGYWGCPVCETDGYLTDNI